MTNDFVASKVEQSPSAQSFMPAENDFQPQQPHARFVGELENAEMREIDTTANAKEASPAPTIVQASHTREIEDCETPEVCDRRLRSAIAAKRKNHQRSPLWSHSTRSNCQGLAQTRPTPENRIAARYQTTLQPLKVTKCCLDSDHSDCEAKLANYAESQNDSGNGNSAQTQNKAQMLIPIAPAALQELKAEVDEIAKQKAQCDCSVGARSKLILTWTSNRHLLNNSFAGPPSAGSPGQSCCRFCFKQACADAIRIYPKSISGNSSF